MSQKVQQLVQQFIEDMSDQITERVVANLSQGLGVKPVQARATFTKTTKLAIKAPVKEAAKAKTNGHSTKKIVTKANPTGPTAKIMKLLAGGKAFKAADLAKNLKIKPASVHNTLAYLSKANKIVKGSEKGTWAAAPAN